MYTYLLLSTLLPLLVASFPVEKRQTTSGNDLVNGDCGDMVYIFARGTTEIGNLGTVIGPPLGRELSSQFGDVAVQGVDYPANELETGLYSPHFLTLLELLLNVAGFLAGGSREGANTMADLARQAITQCPGVPIVMSGYSQGAKVVSRAIEQLTADEASNVGAVVLFGNPNGEDPVPNTQAADVEVFCNRGDLICTGANTVVAPHLTYGSDAVAAADFVATRIQA